MKQEMWHFQNTRTKKRLSSQTYKKITGAEVFSICAVKVWAYSLEQVEPFLQTSQSLLR